MIEFSFSKIDLFHKCPRAYKYKYLDHEKEAFDTIECYLGSTVHKTIKWGYVERNIGKPLVRDELINRYDILWKVADLDKFAVIKRGHHRDEYYYEGRQMLLSYYDRVMSHNMAETISMEQRLSCLLDHDIEYWGIVDRIESVNDGLIRIIDYKTGKHVESPADSLQMLGYAVAYFDANKCDSVIVVNEDLRGYRTLESLVERNRGDDIKNHLRHEIAEIVSTNTYYSRPSVLCNWCGYHDNCVDAELFE